MFKLSDTAIQGEALRATMEDVSAGALVVFEGRVRNHNDGMQVLQLEYEAYPALALSEGNAVINEARKRFAVKDCVCVHRTGALKLGETAVWVGATAAHRDAAFAATRFVIDEIKRRVPIWKKEHYVNGDSGWVNCAHSHDELNIADSPAPGAVQAVAPFSGAIDMSPTCDDWRLDILDLSTSQLAAFELIDIRERDEDPSQLLRSLLRRDVRPVPLSQLDVEAPGLDPEKQYLFISQRGASSAKLVEQLRNRGHANAYSLTGGVEAVRRKFIA